MTGSEPRGASRIDPDDPFDPWDAEDEAREDARDEQRRQRQEHANRTWQQFEKKQWDERSRLHVGALADLYAQEKAGPGATLETIELLRKEAYRHLVDAIRRRVFEQRNRSSVLWFPDTIRAVDFIGGKRRHGKSRLTVGRLEQYLADWGFDAVARHVLANCWLPSELASRWLNDHGLKAPSYWLPEVSRNGSSASALTALQRPDVSEPPGTHVPAPTESPPDFVQLFLDASANEAEEMLRLASQEEVRALNSALFRSISDPKVRAGLPVPNAVTHEWYGASPPLTPEEERSALKHSAEVNRIAERRFARITRPDLSTLGSDDPGGQRAPAQEAAVSAKRGRPRKRRDEILQSFEKRCPTEKELPHGMLTTIATELVNDLKGEGKPTPKTAAGWIRKVLYKRQKL